VENLAKDADDDFFSHVLLLHMKIMFTSAVIAERNDHGYELRRRRHMNVGYSDVQPRRPTMSNEILCTDSYINIGLDLGTNFFTSQLSIV